LVVRNNTASALQEARAYVRVPAGLAVLSAEPRAAAEGRMLEWQLGALPPHQERKLRVRLSAEASGELVAQAWATFTCASSLNLHVQEPKLVLKTKASDHVTLGDSANIVFTVSNTGEGTAEQVKIQANLSDGLEHASGKHVELQVGSLAPGESRSATLVCAPKTGGQHVCEAVALTEAGLAARDQVTLTAAAPRLVVQAIGPGLRYLDRKALYTFRVRNPGDAPATQVVLEDAVPDGMKFLAASDGGQHDALRHHVAWRLGDIGAGQTREVRLELAAVTPGEYRQRVAAQSAQGQAANVEIRTRAEGVPTLVAEVTDTDDPVEVGAETTYEVRLVNTGSKEDTAVALACTIPDKMEFKAAQGPCRYRVQGRSVVFEALPRLAPHADALFRVTVRGIAAGDARFKIQVNSASLTEPLLRTESTRIYADAGQ
ncbi:MAG TPA: CARDB domain-containing protein, partial [Gemmataceae bacterium]|nr:CARDB domain-containing protein [Gemmataceae bacterium]